MLGPTAYFRVSSCSANDLCQIGVLWHKRRLLGASNALTPNRSNWETSMLSSVITTLWGSAPNILFCSLNILDNSTPVRMVVRSFDGQLGEFDTGNNCRDVTRIKFWWLDFAGFNWFWAYFLCKLCFYNRNGFSWGLNPEPPINTSRIVPTFKLWQSNTLTTRLWRTHCRSLKHLFFQNNKTT